MTTTAPHQHQTPSDRPAGAGPTAGAPAVGALSRTSAAPDWRDETGAQTAEYGIVTLAAVGFAGVLAVVLAGTDVQGLLLDIVKNALSFG